MKATGIVRRVDDLGRIVIPSFDEIRYNVIYQNTAASIRKQPCFRPIRYVFPLGFLNGYL